MVLVLGILVDDQKLGIYCHTLFIHLVLVITDSCCIPFTDLVMVERSCWNSSAVEEMDEDFLKCGKVMGTSKACYCNKELCNGRQPLLASGLVMFISMMAAILFVKRTL